MVADFDTYKLIYVRRRQILVHSYLYYFANTQLISDSTFDAWSKELANLQRENPDAVRLCPYYEAFKDFDGSTGCDLPYNLPEIVEIAERLREGR